MSQKYSSKDKVVQKMTKDGLSEVNVTKGTKENISSRIQDISLERNREKMDLKGENHEKKRKKRKKSSISDGIDSYNKQNNPGFDSGSFASANDLSAKKSRKQTTNDSSESIKKSGKNISHFRLKSTSDQEKIKGKKINDSNADISKLQRDHGRASIKYSKLSNKQKHRLRSKLADVMEDDQNSLQSDTIKTVREGNRKLQKGVRFVRKFKISREKEKIRKELFDELQKNRTKVQNSKLQFGSKKVVKKSGKFMFGAGSLGVRSVKDKAVSAVENDKGLHADTLKFVQDTKQLTGTKINAFRSRSNLNKKKTTQKDLNKEKSRLYQKNREIMQHGKDRNLKRVTDEEKKKLQKGMYKKQYAAAVKSKELKTASDTITVNQNRFVRMIKASKAAMVRVATALSSLFGIPIAVMFFLLVLGLMAFSMAAVAVGVTSSAVYQSADIEITKTNGYFSEMETDLQIDIDDTEINHSGYDEYEYDLDNIGHDPHLLIPYFSTKYPKGFKEKKIRKDIEKIFNEMYDLERIPRTEKRSNGHGGTYTVTILRTVLRARPLMDVLNSNMNENEKKSFKMFHEAKGCFDFMKSPVTDEWKVGVLRRFGYGKDPDSGSKVFYPAMDIEPPSDGKVFAVVKGIVHYGSDDFGAYLEIKTEAGQRVRYTNVSGFLIPEGEEVEKGIELCSFANSSSDSYIRSSLRLQVIDKKDNYLDPYFYLFSNTDKLSDAYLVDYSQTNGYTNDPNYEFPEDLDPEEYDDWVKRLLAEAQKHLGKRYVFGSNGPNTFDCSSFVCWTFTHSKVRNMPRTTAQALYNATMRVSKSELRPGDLVFFTGTYNAGRPVTHIGIYVGEGTMIHAGDPIQYANLNSNYWQNHYYGGGRVIP